MANSSLQHNIDGSGKEFSNVGQLHFFKASSFSSRPSHEHYDYIIVGGGTAGCPLAATLSQKYSVLLLERGGSPYGNANVSWLQNFHIGLADTSPASASQPFISTDGVINARARVLGGGSCINAGFYTRASTSYVRDAGWDAELVSESYPWVEKQIVHRPKVAPWQAAVRDGLLQAGVDPFNGFTYDHLYGTKVGGTIFDERGFRSTAADLLSSGNPDNLRVLLHATAQKILLHKRGTTTAATTPEAVGVEFKDELGNRHLAYLRAGGRSQVIVASGTLGSPQLLMLSGIGPRSELRRLNVPLVRHNRHVGKHLSDNPMNSIFMPTRRPVEQSLIQIVGITKMGSFIEASSGFGQSSDSILCHHGIMSAEIGQLSTIPPKQRTLEAAREYARNKHKLPREVFQGGFLLEKVDGPLSTGRLSLVDADAETTPNVTFNYFSHPQDLRRCVSGIRTLEKIVRSKHVAELTDDRGYTTETLLNMTVRANVNLIPKHTNDTASLEQFCRDTVVTIWHYHGGCRVGKVVDEDYRVMGVGALRVIDSSTFSSSPGTNPQATVMMLGRYMGVKMLKGRLGRAAGD
ncbi:protein HOTHEAD-like isoform X2 [Iris pallida]|uniref:Protein HOTHEAD-like isoform X2 n=1 Tax=Iris pallida TaxID=29817 RepID=A0AAX6EGF9_IRIPA|nr:protein HOTHEAD-like isoform X2 [Iris pallida]